MIYNRQHYIGLYAQDNWKVTPRLTASYGVRWEPFTTVTSKHLTFVHFDKNLFDQNVHSKVLVNAPAGLVFPGDSQWQCGDDKVHCNRWFSGAFAPRIGLAWDPQGNGRMSIRAAYGMFFDRAHLQSLTGFGQNVPFGYVITLSDVPDASDPWATYPGGRNPVPVYIQPDMSFPASGRYVTHPFNLKPTTQNQWNVSIQKQIGSDWAVTANYVGSFLYHLQTGNELNPAVFLGLDGCVLNGVRYPVCSTTANTQARRVLNLQNPSQGLFYDSLAGLDDGGTTRFNGLFLSTQKRASRGVSILANYTWSHCVGDFWNFTVGASGLVRGYNPAGRRAERGNCAEDQRHVLNLSAVLQTPTLIGHRAGRIASNWQFSPILRLRSGQYFTVTTGLDNALNGVANQRPNQVLADPYMVNKSADRWLNPNAFANPALGTYGNLGRSNLVGPGSFQLDLSVTRTFPIGEGKNIQFRGEAFNVPNHVNLDIPVAALNSPAFGKIQNDISGNSGLSPGNQRILQLALKIVF